MLKGHRACIDLDKNVLRISGKEVAFLPEHELPKSAFNDNSSLVDEPSSGTSEPSSSGPQTHFPGSGNTLGSAPGVSQQPQPSSRWPEAAIQTLMGLGASREIAIQSLDAAGGNVDIAASLLF